MIAAVRHIIEMESVNMNIGTPHMLAERAKDRYPVISLRQTAFEICLEEMISIRF
jgi:hypothetical protein